MEAMSYIDSSGLHLLKQLIEDLQKKELNLLFSGASAPINELLHTSGIVALLGEENIFSETHEAETYAQNKATTHCF